MVYVATRLDFRIPLKIRVQQLKIRWNNKQQTSRNTAFERQKKIKIKTPITASEVSFEYPLATDAY